MKPFSILLITILLSFSCLQLSAQENPFMEMVGKRYADYSQELHDQYLKFRELDTVEAQQFIRQVEEVADKTGSMEWRLRAARLELELLDMRRSLYGEERFTAEAMLKAELELLEKAKKANTWQMELGFRYMIIEHCWYHLRNYELALEQCSVQDAQLQNISTEEFPEKAFYYVQIANAHYAFKDYAKAIVYFRKILEDEETVRNQPARQSALNGMGLSCRDGYNDLDCADSCFRAILQTNYLRPEDECNRDNWDGIAEGNLAYNMLLRGEYDNAIPLFKSSLGKMLRYHDYGYASGPAINLADIYLRKGNTAEAKRYINLAREYYNITPRDGRLPRIYEVMSKYYAAMGNMEQSVVCMDSMLAANKEYEKQFNAMLLLRMEQKESAQRQQALVLEKEQRRRVQQRLLFFSVGFVVISILLVMLYIVYRRRQAAYRALVVKTQQWAQVPFVQAVHKPEDDDKTENKEDENPNLPSAEPNGKPTETDRQLFGQLNRLVAERQIYLDPDATLDQIALLMQVSRMYLSQAVNRCTGANFSTFINEFRVKEAVRLMSDKKSKKLSIEGIALDAGFNDRISFYRAFKKSTGVSPTTFRDNLEK